MSDDWERENFKILDRDTIAADTDVCSGCVIEWPEAVAGDHQGISPNRWPIGRARVLH